MTYFSMNSDSLIRTTYRGKEDIDEVAAKKKISGSSSN